MSDRDLYDPDQDAVTSREDPNPGERGKWVSLLVGVLGLWLLVEAAIFEITAANFWNDVIIGLALLALGGYNYYRRAGERMGSVSTGVFVALLGVWMLAAPFIVTPEATVDQTPLSFWNDLIVGALAILLGSYSAYEAGTDAATTAAATR